MKIYFSLVSLALAAVALSGAALSWDGSYYLFELLDQQEPFIAHNRLVALPFQMLVLLAGNYTNDVSILKMVFGLAYALIPILSMAAAWWIVRNNARPLFVWAVLGIGLGTLPGLLPLFSEAIMVVQLFWPILLAILVPPRLSHIPVVVLFALLAFFTHPTVIMLFGFAAFLAFITGWRYKEQRWQKWGWMAGLLLLMAIAIVRFMVLKDSYETDRISLDVIGETFATSLAGFPLLSLICAWLAAVLVFVATFIKQPSRRVTLLAVYAAELGLILTAGILLVIRSTVPRLWMGELDYRTWVIVCSLPFMLICAFEALYRTPAMLRAAADDWAHRLRTVQVIGIVFLLVLAVQSMTWYSLTRQLDITLQDSPLTCIPASSIDWIIPTPMNHWSTTTYSILLQGRVPKKIILADGDCTKVSSQEGLHVVPWDERKWSGGWFDFRLLGRQLVSR